MVAGTVRFAVIDDEFPISTNPVNKRVVLFPWAVDVLSKNRVVEI